MGIFSLKQSIECLEALLLPVYAVLIRGGLIYRLKLVQQVRLLSEHVIEVVLRLINPRLLRLQYLLDWNSLSRESPQGEG